MVQPITCQLGHVKVIVFFLFQNSQAYFAIITRALALSYFHFLKNGNWQFKKTFMFMFSKLSGKNRRRGHRVEGQAKKIEFNLPTKMAQIIDGWS